MTISTFERSATIAEMAVEIDRRGAVIERLEAERDALKAALVQAKEWINDTAAMPTDTGWIDAALSPAQGGE